MTRYNSKIGNGILFFLIVILGGVSIDTIREISETNNPLSSPANSLDRLEINYSHKGTILISPKNKAGFLNQLIEINPKIELKIKNEDLLNKIKQKKKG